MYSFAKLTCALALGAVALCAQTVSTLSVETTGMVGIAAGETVRLNLLNPGVLAPAVGATCTATVTYLGPEDGTLKTATVTVDPGKSQSVDLRSDMDLSLTAGDREQIRAQISTQNSCKLIPTLEIFDFITGRTQVVLGHTVAVPSVVAGS
jgi:hypothetical protein